MRALILVLLLAACGPATRIGADDPRGDTNGRMFDFVSTKPDGSEWTIRVRGDSMWVGYSTASKSKDFDPVTLAPKEATKLWRLIDAVDIPDREEGRPDQDVGSVYLRLREPEGEDRLDHDLIGTYVDRDTDDEDVIDLAAYLIDLIQTHHDVAPAF
jgi:hypothetical protein